VAVADAVPGVGEAGEAHVVGVAALIVADDAALAVVGAIERDAGLREALLDHPVGGAHIDVLGDGRRAVLDELAAIESVVGLVHGSAAGVDELRAVAHGIVARGHGLLHGRGP